MTPAGAAAATAPAATATAIEDEELELAVITSPIVGTFYRSPDPSSPAFVDVGQTIRKGQTLCIIEAMKLMNEIESEYEGQVVKVYVENGQPVQYGERMFAIKRS
jgi:acetyl-CoA carboxylase biotin carboxyl carrier protein